MRASAVIPVLNSTLSSSNTQKGGTTRPGALEIRRRLLWCRRADSLQLLALDAAVA